MRKTSCIHVFMMLLCCLAARVGHCQKMLAVNTAHQPQFISGMYMGQHFQGEVTENIIGPKEGPAEIISVPAAALAMPKTTDAIDKVVIQKNDLAEIRDSVSAAVNEPDMVENKEMVSSSEVRPALVTTTEPGTKINTVPGNNSEDALEEVTDPVINKYAEIVGLDPTDINNYPLYRFIDEWYGTRYKWGGTDNTGIDCSAFSQKLYSTVYGIDLMRTAKQQHHNCDRIKNPDGADEGDLVFFRIHHFGISHVGIYLANGYFVHASRSQGVVISNLNTRYWHKRFAACGKVQKDEKTNLESDYLQ